MKKILSACLILAAMIGLASCDNRPDIVGQWQGKMDCPVMGATTSTANANFTFTRDGKVTATYLIDFTKSLAVTPEFNVPLEASVAANASVNGTWQYVNNEDDEVAISFDDQSLVVNVDPDMLVISSGAAAVDQTVQIDSLRPILVDQMQQLVAMSIRKSTSNLLLEDVEVQKPLLKFEINDVDYVFQEVQAK